MGAVETASVVMIASVAHQKKGASLFLQYTRVNSALGMQQRLMPSIAKRLTCKSFGNAGGKCSGA